MSTNTRWRQKGSRERASRVALILAIVLTIGCDRVTKHVATSALLGAPAQEFLAGTVRLVYAENQGGFLSLGASMPALWRTLVLTVGTGLMLVGVVVMAVRRRWRGAVLVGAGLFVAGGVSNWIDRLIHGAVVDFLNVGIGPLRTGVFNVADVAIMVGAAVVVFAGTTSTDDEPEISEPRERPSAS